MRWPRRSGGVRSDLYDPGGARHPKALLWYLLLAPFAGFAIAVYLTFMHYRGLIPTCYVVHGCQTVQASTFSEVLGIPIALFGAVFFAIMFYLAIGLLINSPIKLLLAYKPMAYSGALAAIPLFLLQAVVLKAYCSYCLVVEVLLLAIWLGSFFLGPLEEGDEEGAKQTAPGIATTRNVLATVASTAHAEDARRGTGPASRRSRR